jgi:myo-inositol-1(or 4)-monophosphatase
VNDQALLAICGEVVDAVKHALDQVDDWSLPGGRPGQFGIDLAADSAALEVLDRTELGVLSEESGLRRPGSPLMAVIDPVDGSTNASRGISWYACSVCVLDELGPAVSVVANLSSGVRYSAVRGAGAWRDGKRLAPSECGSIGEAVVALSGYPRKHMGWSQYRAFGAAALDLCAVAEGTIDAYAVVGRSALGSWDYLGGMLVCTEAGAEVAEIDGLDLVTTEHAARRSVAAAGTSRLLAQVVEGAKAARPSGQALASDPPRGPGSSAAAD